MANINLSAPQEGGNGLQNLVQAATSTPVGATNETPFYASNCTQDGSSTGATGCHSTDPPDSTSANVANDLTELSISASTSTPVRVPPAAPFHDSFLTPIPFSAETPHSDSTDTPFQNSTGTPVHTLMFTPDGESIGSSISASTSIPGSVSAGTSDSATNTSVQIDPVQRSFQRLEAVSRYLKITEERQTQNIVKICSFNIKNTLNPNELTKCLVQRTLDNILPDMLLLQEPIWSGGINVKKNITESELHGKRYSLVSREWASYESPSQYSNTEVTILYDPKVLLPSFSHELISESWSVYMKEVVRICEQHPIHGKLKAVKNLPSRTMAYGAISTHHHSSEAMTAWYQSFNAKVRNQSSDVVAEGCKTLVTESYQSIIDMETEPTYKAFIGVSLHMFRKETMRDKSEEKEKLQTKAPDDATMSQKPKSGRPKSAKKEKLEAKTSDDSTMDQETTRGKREKEEKPGLSAKKPEDPKMDHDAILFISEEVIKKAENLAVYFKRPVIIGADWNVNVKHIDSIIVQRQTAQPALTFWNMCQDSKLDSIVCIYPNNSARSNVTKASFDWQETCIKVEFPDKEKIIREAFKNHEPIVVNIKPM